jgi:hypothetical protein
LVVPVKPPLQLLNRYPLAGVAVIVTVVPALYVPPEGLNATVPEPVTAVVMVYCCGTTIDRTTIRDVAVKLPSAVTAVMVAVPCANAVTNPVLVTEAIAGALELQVTALLVAVAGTTVAVSCLV